MSMFNPTNLSVFVTAQCFFIIIASCKTPPKLCKRLASNWKEFAGEFSRELSQGLSQRPIKDYNKCSESTRQSSEAKTTLPLSNDLNSWPQWLVLTQIEFSKYMHDGNRRHNNRFLKTKINKYGTNSAMSEIHFFKLHAKKKNNWPHSISYFNDKLLEFFFKVICVSKCKIK